MERKLPEWVKWLGLIVAIPLGYQALSALWSGVINKYMLGVASLYELGGTTLILILLAIPLATGVVILHRSSKDDGQEKA